MSKRSEDAARNAMAEIDSNQTEQVGSDLSKDQIMSVARQFARILLEDAGEMKRPEPQTETEDFAQRFAAQPNHNRDAFRHFIDPNATDDDIDLAEALTDLGSSLNSDAAFDGRKEPIANVFKPADILDQLVAAVRDRRGR